MLEMWQEERGKPYWRFQTDEKSIADKMKRRKKFSLNIWGDNCRIWVFVAEFKRPDIARNAFKTLSGEKAILDRNEDIYYTESYYTKKENKAA